MAMQPMMAKYIKDRVTAAYYVKTVREEYTFLWNLLLLDIITGVLEKSLYI